MSNRKNERGFTLVELSIVLVIIGLIVGGVLAGQSLINSAKLQAEVTQFNKIDTAVNAFYLKFNGLPGDMANSSGFTTAGVANGNADGYIGGTAGVGAGGAVADITTYTSTEEANAAAELFELGLLPGTAVNPTGTSASAISTSGGDVLIGKALIGSGILLFGNAAVSANNNWAFYGIQNASTSAVKVEDLYGSDQVLSIDSKMDDGIATTGLVQSRDNANNDLLTVGVTGCNSAAGAGGGIYTAKTTAVCAFMIRLSQ